MKAILKEIELETIRQVQKWGIQNHPSLNQKLLLEECTPDEMCKSYEIPTEERARELCETAANSQSVTWAHITIEELSESISAKTDTERRTELIQLAAVIASWIESIDRNLKNK